MSFLIFLLFAIIVESVSERPRQPLYECGHVTPAGAPLVAGGGHAARGELPWHVAVYRKTSRPYRQICGGTIVSRKLVISAAHCFRSGVEAEAQAEAAQFAVAGGKIHKSWDDDRDVDAQKTNVSELLIPPLFRGADRNFAEDLALLVLAPGFRFRPYLRPACLDFRASLEMRQLAPGSKGKVAGWGLVSAGGERTTVLNVIELPVVSTAECLKRSPHNYWEYITADKICAGYDTGEGTLCQGDSGGGLVFPERGARGERYYLRGVVSTAPSSDRQCNAFAITSFTRLSAHAAFITQRYRPDDDDEDLSLNVDGDPSAMAAILLPNSSRGAPPSPSVLSSSSGGDPLPLEVQRLIEDALLSRKGPDVTGPLQSNPRTTSNQVLGNQVEILRLESTLALNQNQGALNKVELITQQDPLSLRPNQGALYQKQFTTQENPLSFNLNQGSLKQADLRAQRDPLVSGQNKGTLHQTEFRTQGNPNVIVIKESQEALNQMPFRTQENPLSSGQNQGTFYRTEFRTQENPIRPSQGVFNQVEFKTQENPLSLGQNQGSFYQTEFRTQGNPMAFKLNQGGLDQVEFGTEENPLSLGQNQGALYQMEYRTQGNPLAFKQSQGLLDQVEFGTQKDPLSLNQNQGAFYQTEFRTQGNPVTFSQNQRSSAPVRTESFSSSNRVCVNGVCAVERGGGGSQLACLNGLC